MDRKKIWNGTVIFTILALVVLVYHCKNPKIDSGYSSPEVLATHFNGEDYVGSETCIECHLDIYSNHVETAHFNTSAIADSTNIKGNFQKGSNVLDLESVRFIMESEGNAFYQHTNIKNRTVEIPIKRFDIVIGSGVRGQTYCNWQGDSLFQLQPSYYTQNGNWVNSPGYPQYYLERPIRDACLKCHATFAVNRSFPLPGNRYDKGKMIFGVDCERCHRPAKKHVVFHRQNPKADVAKFMLPLDSFTRQQRLDVCAQCHSGPRNLILKGSSFSFLAGQNLEEHSRNPDTGNQNRVAEVHGNQYGLLTESKCFKQSKEMDCSTCHNPHQNQRGNTGYFNQKCMECHTGNAIVCSDKSLEKEELGNNCIDCHMPVSPSRKITVQLNTTDSLETSFKIRSHLIAIYGRKKN